MSISADPSHLQDTPPARALLRLIAGNWISRAIYVMAKLGIADLLRDGPQGRDVLAQATGTDAHALYRVLRTLASVGVLVEDEAARFGLTPLGTCLQTGVPGSLRAWALQNGEENYRVWAEVSTVCTRASPRLSTSSAWASMTTGRIIPRPPCGSTKP